MKKNLSDHVRKHMSSDWHRKKYKEALENRKKHPELWKKYKK